MRIAFTGGGSAGHFFPIIAVARELKQIAEDQRILEVQLFYLGPDDGRSAELIREDILPVYVAAGKMRRYFSWRNFTDIFATIKGILQCLWKLFVIMPDVVFSKGGFGSFPVLFAARLYKIPVMIHDSDAVPGRVSRWSGGFARKIGVAFERAAEFFPGEKTAVVGNPIRKRILGGVKDRAKEHFSIFSERPVLLILGGGLGAEPINQVILGGLAGLIKDFEIIHQAGQTNFSEVSEQSRVILTSEMKPRYHPFGFLSESQLREALAACDLIIARAGSNVFEIAAAGKPSILIPLPHSAQDHQRANAYEYAKISGALVIEESNLTPGILHHTALRIFENPGELKKMSEGAQRFARVDSAELIAREIISLGLSH